MAWVLAHTDSLFHFESVAMFGLEEHVTSEFLNQYRYGGGSIASWPGTMRERLRCRDLLKDLLEAGRTA
jgi:hypothetical protein